MIFLELPDRFYAAAPFHTGVNYIMGITRVLVVEDFERFRRLICSALEEWPDFQVNEISDGLEAIEKAKQFHPDLILLDIGLPGLNGLDVARRIREYAPGTQIIFLSQESSPDVVREALNLGNSCYVQKSRLRTDLRPAIEAALENRQFVTVGMQDP